MILLNIFVKKGVIHKKIIYMQNKDSNQEVEIAMQYTEGYTESIFAFANNINTTEGGTHLSGFREQLPEQLMVCEEQWSFKGKR